MPVYSCQCDSVILKDVHSLLCSFATSHAEPRAAGLRALDIGGGGGGVVAAGCALGVATICFCLCCCGVGGVVDSGCSLCGALVVFSVGQLFVYGGLVTVIVIIHDSDTLAIVLYFIILAAVRYCVPSLMLLVQDCP